MKTNNYLPSFSNFRGLRKIRGVFHDYYRIGKYINKGSYGKVYDVKDVELVSAAKTLAISDSGKVFMCESSGGAVAITLPTASSGEDGVYYKFIVEEETPSNDITIGAGSAIISLVAKDAGGDLAVSTAGTQVSNVILDTTAQKGDYVEFMFTKGEYVASSMSGINNGIQTS